MDSFTSSTCSVTVGNTMNAGRGGKPPAEVRAPKRTGYTVIDFSGMKYADEGGSDLEVEELNISSDHDKQDTSDSKTGSEADTAAGKTHTLTLTRTIVLMRWTDAMPTILAMSKPF